MADLMEQARQYLASQHITLWGQSFDILNGDLDEAATWLVDTIRDFDRFKRRNGKA